MTSIIFNTLKENRKRILSWVCILSMFLNTLPVSSFASEAGEIVPDPVEVVQEAVQEEPESVVPAVQEPADEPAGEPAAEPDAEDVKDATPAVDSPDEEHDAPAADPEPVLDNKADIAPVVGDIEPDTGDILSEGQDMPSGNDEDILPSLFIDFPATGVFSEDTLSVSYKYTSAKNEELVISLDNIAAEIEVKYLSDEMPVETVRTEDEETGYAYYRLSALKDEAYLIRVFVEKAEEEIPYSVTITEYKESASDVEPDVGSIEPDNAGDALIDIPPEATNDEPEASNNTEPESGMIDIFPDLPDNNDTSAFDNFLNDNTEPAEETPAEENDEDEQEPAEDIIPVEPTNEEIPDENTEPVEPEGQVSEDTEEPVGEEPAVEEPVVEPEGNNNEEDADNDAQDAEITASDADLPDILPDTETEGNDAFDGFLVDDENNEEEPAEDNTAEEAPADEATDENAAEDTLDEEENLDDFLVTDDEEDDEQDGEEKPAPADETVDELTDEEAEKSVPEENEQPNEATEGEEESSEDATGEQDEAPTDKEESESSDEDEATADESESEDGEEPSEGEDAEESKEEETIDLDEETLTVVDGVYTYTGHGMTVTVETTEENALPEGTEFVLAPVSAEEERVQDYIAQAAELNGVDASAIIPYVYDMHFEMNGEEVHIAEGSSVKVNIVFDKALDLGDVIAAPFYHIIDGKLVALIQDVTQKEEVMPTRGAKGMMKAAPAKAEVKTEEDTMPEEEQKVETKTIESLEFTVGSFSDFMLTGVKGGTRAVDKYYILYSNGDFIIQDGNTTDPSRGTVVDSAVIPNGEFDFSLVSAGLTTITNVYINTTIVFTNGTGESEFFHSLANLKNIYNVNKIDLSNNTKLDYAFADCQKLQHVYGLDAWNTSSINSVQYLFAACKMMENISDIEGWNLTITVKDGVRSCFSGCFALTSIDLSGWDLSRVSDATYMFYMNLSNYSQLTSVNLGNIFTAANETNVYLSCMFINCGKLESVNDIFTNISRTKTVSLHQAFYGCDSLCEPQNVNLSGLNIISLQQAFYLTNIRSIDLSNCTIRGSTSFESTFATCYNLESISMSGLTTTSSSSSLKYTFSLTRSLHSLDLSSVFFSLGNKNKEFLSGSGIEEITLGSDFLFQDAILPNGVWERDSTGEQYTAKQLKDAWDSTMADTYTLVDPTDYDHIYVIQYNNGDLVFQGNDIIDETKGGVKAQWVYDAYPAEISMASNVNTWRSDQSYRLQVKRIYIDTPIRFQVANTVGSNNVFFSGFNNCEYIYGIDNIDLSNQSSLGYCFRECRNLKHIYGLEDWDVHTITDIPHLFYSCDVLENIPDVEGWNLTLTGNGRLNNAFSSCKALTSLDLSTWDLTEVTNLYSTFSSSESLVSVNLGSVFTAAPNQSSTEISLYNLFFGCKNLTTINDIFANIPLNCKISMNSFLTCYSNHNHVFSMDIDLSGHTITNLYRAFCGCEGIRNIDMSNCNFPGVVDVKEAFEYCRGLESIDFSNITAEQSCNRPFATFRDTESLSYLDLSSGFFAGSDKDEEFLQGSGITRITLGSQFAFGNASLPLGVWERESTGDQYTAGQLKAAWNSTMADTYILVDPTDYDNKYVILYSNGDMVFQENGLIDTSRGEVVFAEACLNEICTFPVPWLNYKNLIKNIYFDTNIKMSTNVHTSGNGAFSDCGNLEYVYDVYNWDISNSNSLINHFRNCSKLKHIYGLSEWDTHTITSIKGLFNSCLDLDNINDIETWNLTIVDDGLNRTFYRCTELKSIDLSSWDLSRLTSLQETFHSCSVLKTVDLGNIFTNADSNINLKSAFDYCYQLVEINGALDNIPSGISISLTHAFEQCYDLAEIIDLSNHIISSMDYSFNKCYSIKYIDLSGCTLSGSAQNAFYGCNKLRKLDLTNVISSSSSVSLLYAFTDTSTLAYLDLSSPFFNDGGKSINTFEGSGISKVTLGDGFLFRNSTLPNGNWKRESTGEIYTAAQLKSAWNSSMADTYEKVNVVIFDANGGDVYPHRLVKHLDEVFEAEDFPSATREGYTFVGWFSDDIAGNEIHAGNTIDQDIYFAHWSENGYTLVLKKNDPNDPDDTEIRVPLSYTDRYQLSSSLFTVDNKVLQKWSTYPDGTGTVYGPDERVGMLSDINSDEVYLYANWGRAQTVTVTFDSQGGSPVETIVVEKYSELQSSQLVASIKDGYTFDGWWTDPTDGERWDTTDHVMSESVQLYAHWTANPLITFEPNGGYISKLSMSVPYGSTLADLPWGADTSRKLVGFFTSPTFGQGEQLTTSTVITEDVTYYAQWGYQPYFNLAGGRYSGSYSIDTAYPLSASNLIEITSFPPVIRDGYTLVRWMLPDGTTVNIGDTIDRDLYPEIIAEWDRADTVTVTFDPNGGTFSQYAETESSTLCKKYDMVQGDSLSYYPDAYKSTNSMRLEFLGWYDENDVLYTRDSIITDDIILYAKWQDSNRIPYIFIVYGGQYQATSMYNNSTTSVTGGRKTTVYRTKGEEFGVLPGLSVYTSGTTLNGKCLDGWYSDPEPFNLDGTLKDGVEKLTPTTAKTVESTWYAYIVNNVVNKYDDQTSYKYYTEWTNASNNDVSNSNNNLDFHPQSTNSQTAQLHMHFELNSEVTETLPVGSVRITFPKSVWKDWNGNDVGTTNISAQLPKYPQIQSGMFFSYAEDGNGNYVILNNQEISGGAGVDLTIAYTVDPLLVPGGAIDRDNDYVSGYNYYSGNVPVVFEIDRDAVTTYETVNDVPVLTDTFVADVHEDKNLTIEMHTKVDISIAKEYISTSYNWSSSWGTEPDDAKDYFYITWRTKSRYNINQPFTQFITEDTVHDGTVVYNSFESQYPMGREITANSQNIFYYTVVTRHPKSLLDNIPATGVTFRNQVRHVANWKSGYVTDYVADSEHTIYNWSYPPGEFDKTNVRGASSISSISPFGAIGTHAPTSPRYVTYSGAQNKILGNNNLTLEWELTYDGWSSGTPILWDDDTNTYSRQQRIISLTDGNNNDIMYSSGSPSARYVWEPITGNVPLTDYDYSVNRLRVYVREYDGEYRNGEWGGPVLRDDFSMWNDVYVYVRYKNTENLVYFTRASLTGTGTSTNNGYAYVDINLPSNVAGWEVRYPSSYFRTYIQVNEEVILYPTADVKSYIATDVINKATSIIKNRGYCDIWTSDDVFADPSGIFFHSTDYTGGYNGANKEIYELTYQAGQLHTNKSASNQNKVIFDVQRGIQENPMAIYGRNYYNNGMQPITSGRFYDLLPRGATVDPSSIYGVLQSYNSSNYISTNYANNYTTTPENLTGYLPKEYYDVEFVENWRNSGRTMMIINYRAPSDRNTNMATFYYLLRMTYQDVISYGTSVQNDVAFMDTSGTNRYDTTSSSSMRNAISVLGDDATYYEDVSVMEDAVVYAVAPTNYIPVDAYSWGFFKSVNTRNSYSQEDITIPNNIYTYKLNYAQSDTAEVTDMVFFDVLERGAYDNAFNGGTLERASEWEGEFDSIDITPLTALLKKGSTASNKVYCAPVVYYSTKAKDQFTGSDWNVSNTATWTTTMPAKNLITAIAVDCTTSSDGTPFIMQGRNNAMFYVRMRSSSDPNDVGKITVNQGMFQATVNNEPNEATSDTAVTLTEEEPEIHKESDPETGTAAEPAIVVPGEPLTYTLSITNKNSDFTVPNIIVEDPIPSAVRIDTNNIKVHFGNTDNEMTVFASPRTRVRISGNNLVFTIKSLEPNETCYFTIPCSVKNEAGQDIINTATITSVNDVEKEIDSETTYHKIGFRVPFSKLSTSGEYLAGATLQLWNTDGAEDELIEEWVSSGSKHDILLMPGNYVLKETDVPEGYEFASDIPFELQIDGTIVFEDTSTDSGVTMVDEAIAHVHGVKTWKYDDAATRPASITVRLMRMVEGDATPTYTGTSLPVTEQDNWEYDFGNLPKYDIDGHEYIYSVEEVPVTNYTTIYPSGDPDADGLEITFNIRTSTYDSSDRFILYYLYDGRTYGRLFYGNYGESTNPAGTSVQIPSNEFWIAFEADGANNDYGFKIDQIVPVQTTVSSLINDRVAPPSWTETVTAEEYAGGKFPETDHNYFIYDKILMHYTRSMEGGSYDIVNVKDTIGFDIPFNKINEDNEQIGGVTLRLTSVPEPGDAEIEPVEWVTVAGESHIEHLYPGHYLLQETAAAAGYLYADEIAFVVDGEGNVIIDDTTMTSVDMLDKNIDQPYPFKKVWMDNGYESSRPSSVTFNLIRVSDGQTVETVTLTSADADDAHTWSGEFDPVPVVDNNMVPIEYAVREVVNNNDYLVYHDVQNKVGFYITFSNDSDLGTNAYLKIYPLGYSDPDHPGARQGKGALVLDSALNLSSVEGTGMAGKTYFVPILDGVEGFIITKQLIDTTLPDNSVNLEIESIVPATTLEPYTLIGNTGPAASNIFIGANYPNMNTGVTGTETEIHTFLWQKQEDTAENVANTSSIDEIVNYVNKTEVPFVKLWENENGDTSGRPSTVTFNLYNIDDTETVVDTMTVSAGTAASNEYLFTGVPKYNQDGTVAQYIVREDAVSGYHTYYSPDRIFGLLVTFSGTSTAGDGTLKLYTKISNRINTNATLVDYENGSQVSALTGTQMAGKTYYIPVLDPNNPGFVMELTDDTSKTANVSVTAVVPVDYYMQTASLFPGAEVEYAVNQYFSGTNYPAIQMTGASAANRIVSYEYDASQGKEIHNFRNVTSIPVTKIWDDETAADRPASITINAYNVNAPDTIVGSVALTVSDADSDTQWSGTITGLPMYNADGTLAQYVLKEAPTAGYRAVYTVPRGMLVTFSEDSFAGYGDTPSPIRLYSVSKATGTLISNVWSASESSQDISGHMVTGKTFYIPIEEAGSYAFAVYKQSEYYTPLKIESVRLTTQSQAYNHADSGLQIPSGAYTYHGAGQLDLTDRNGYIVYDFTGVVEQADNGGASIDGIITNEIPQYYVTFNKHSETYDILPGATLQILKASDNSIVDEWESNVYDHETQLTPGSYILHEDTPPTGFAQADDIEFTLDGEGTLTVNNETVERVSMMDNELVEVNGQKSWVGDNASQRPASITVNLYQNGQLVDSATATAAGDWKYSFPDMPRYDSNGDPYTYTVSETAIHDYTETDLTPTSSESWVADQSDWDMPGNISVVMEPTITQIPVTSYRMKFSSNSRTESNRYDYFYIYYRKIVNGESKLYKITSANGSDSSGRFGGSIGDLLIDIPSNDIYIVWRSDVSMSYWGFQVVDMIPLDTEPTVNSQEESALPTTDGAYSFGTPLEYTGTSYPETTHNYNDNERIIYHWTGNATTMGYADAYTVSADNGLLVTFDNDSVTNSENDYLTFYCLVGDTWYELPTRLSGNMSSAQVVIPSRTFVMRWLSDSSGTAFGWKVSSVVDYASASVQGCQPVTLPSGTIEMYQGDRYPERQRYGNNESRLYRYIADGLELPDDEDRFGSAVTANITNTRMPDKQNYSIYKQRPDTTLLGGATLRITGRETGASIDIEPIQWTSSSSGPQVVQLRAGQYVLHEVTPPPGYLGADDISFTIDSTGALIINNVTQAAVYMTDLPQTTIAVDKVDYSHQSTSVTGAVLRLYDSNNTALATWTSDGTPHDITEYVTFGNSYRLHEVSAPAGYNIMSEDITVNIASDGTVTLATTEWAVVTGNSVDGYVIKMYNNQGVHFPSTGASDRTWVYLGAVLIMLASAALLIRRKRRHTSA